MNYHTQPAGRYRADARLFTVIFISMRISIGVELLDKMLVPRIPNVDPLPASYFICPVGFSLCLLGPAYVHFIHTIFVAICNSSSVTEHGAEWSDRLLLLMPI